MQLDRQPQEAECMTRMPTDHSPCRDATRTVLASGSSLFPHHRRLSVCCKMKLRRR